jgi:DNA-binding CsgD family transcriptional regulator
MNAMAAQSWLEPLGEREQQILGLISEGFSNREIAQKLSLSLDTVKWYNKQLFSKLGVSSRTQAAAAARQYGLLGTPKPSRAKGTDRPQHNLPHSPTSFIGRQNELAEVKGLLQTSRLVVLTGAGGSGKTRLALQVANSMLGYYPDGAWLVELAPLSEPELVPTAIADALGVSQRGDSAVLTKIKHFLRPKRL